MGEVKYLTEKSSESLKQLSPKNQFTLEKSSEGEIKNETKDLEKEEEANEPTEKSSEGETKQETPESSDQFFSKDQETTEKSSEGEIKVETKNIKKEEKAEDLTEISSESSKQVSSKDHDNIE